MTAGQIREAALHCTVCSLGALRLVLRYSEIDSSEGEPPSVAYRYIPLLGELPFRHRLLLLAVAQRFCAVWRSCTCWLCRVDGCPLRSVLGSLLLFCCRSKARVLQTSFRAVFQKGCVTGPTREPTASRRCADLRVVWCTHMNNSLHV